MTSLILASAIASTTLNCGGGKYPTIINTVTELPYNRIEQCRFDIEGDGLIAFEAKDGITITKSEFYGHDVKRAVWFNDSTNITVEDSFFHGINGTNLGVTGGKNINIRDNVFDAPTDADGIVVAVSPGHSWQIRRIHATRSNQFGFNPNARWQVGTGLGAGMGNLKAVRRGESKGGSYGYFTFHDWVSGMDPKLPYWNDAGYNGDLGALRVRCYWPGMTGRERFKILNRIGNTFTIRCMFGSFPDGDFAFYVDNPAGYVENVNFTGNFLRGGRLSGLSMFYVRGFKIVGNTIVTTRDYGAGTEASENGVIANNRSHNFQHDEGMRNTWSAFQVVEFANNVKIQNNIGIADAVPHGRPQTNLSGDFVFRTSSQYDAEKVGFPRPDGAKTTW